MARDNLYSKSVVWVKITLPLVAIGLLSSLFLLSGTPDPEAALPYSEVDIDQIIREQRVSQPRFAGVLAEGQEIVLIAEAVSTGAGGTDRIRAQSIDGRIDLNLTEYLTLQAAFGDFDMAAQQAILSEDIVLETSTGYRLETEALTLALDRIALHSPTPIRVTGPGITVSADTMDMTGPEGAGILRFNGSVRVLYEPQS